MGAAKKVLGAATQYAKERKQFQTPLADFRIIQEKLAVAEAQGRAKGADGDSV